MTAALSVALVVVAGWLWRTGRSFVHTLTSRQARRQLEDLNEFVAAWQLANRDEVEVMSARITMAQRSMSEATRSARATARHLADIEVAYGAESG